MIATRPAAVDFEPIADPAALLAGRRDRARFVVVPELRFLAIDGMEPPGGPTFTEAIRCLYPVAYELHFMLRRRGVEASIGHLEGRFWSSPDELVRHGPLSLHPDRELPWRLLLPVPVAAGDDEVDEAIDEIAWTRHPSLLRRLHMDRWQEGPAAQVLHVGPYADVGPTMARLLEAIAGAGLRPHGEHHEIYLNDPTRVGLERAKTILRYPVVPRGS